MYICDHRKIVVKRTHYNIEDDTEGRNQAIANIL